MTDTVRVGIDVGGTFTDLVAFNEATGKTLVVKSPSTPHDPSEGVIESINEFLTTHPSEVKLIVHASTVGANLFLGQLGLSIPKGALVTTSGFRDILEIGRQNRPELYNLFFERPRPLIERHLRFVIDERVNFRGQILQAVDEEQVRNISSEILKEEVQTVAIVFLHAYANPENEKRVREILARELPETIIVASHEVDPVYREYERMSTTVINSLMIPVVSRHLEMIEERLRKLEIKAPLYIMQSNGGLATVEVASKLPVATIESGPATGVTAAAHWSRLLGVSNILSFDMGGTTAKAGTVIGGIPQMVGESEVGGLVHSGRSVKGSGYPVRYPFIDLAEISGGGGTIAWVDQGNTLAVGPVSAGADPGPACYGKGGLTPTVTDANLVLGRLSHNGLSGGAIKLFPELAEMAIKETIVGPLGISIEEAASGIIEIINNQMMRALRLVSIERGYDPRDFAMLAFGGSGPMHAAFLAEALGASVIFIPPNSGVFSALGLMLADFRHDFIRSVMKESCQMDQRSLEKAYKDMEEEAFRTLRQEGFAPDQIVTERNLSLRYLGQSYELKIPMRGSLKEAMQQFHLRHHEVYGYSSQNEPIEIVSAHLVAYGLNEKPQLEKAPLVNPVPAAEALLEQREVYFLQTGWMETMVYSRDMLLPGNRIEGPAIIQQYDATSVIPPSWSVTVDGFSNLCLKVGD